MSNLFDEFDSKFDSAALKQDLADVESNNTEYKDVPHDVYEVKITKLELTKSKKGDPMVSCWFKIVAGDYTNQLIFMNQVLTSGFGLHKCNEFLRSLKTELAVDFESFKQYGELLDNIMNQIDGKREFQLNYGTDKGYNTFKIEEVFEV